MPLLENLVCEFFLEWFGGAKIIVAGLNLMRLNHGHIFLKKPEPFRTKSEMTQV